LGGKQDWQWKNCGFNEVKKRLSNKQVRWDDQGQRDKGFLRGKKGPGGSIEAPLIITKLGALENPIAVYHVRPETNGEGDGENWIGNK